MVAALVIVRYLLMDEIENGSFLGLGNTYSYKITLWKMILSKGHQRA